MARLDSLVPLRLTRPLCSSIALSVTSFTGAACEDAAKAVRPMMVEANFIVAEAWLEGI